MLLAIVKLDNEIGGSTVKRIVKAGFLMIGMLAALVACGGGGGGGGASSAITVAVTPSKSSEIANGTLVDVNATFTPALAANTQITFTIAGNATFADGTKTFNTTVTANTATASVKSSSAGASTITATCTGGTGNTTITFTAIPVTLVSGVVSKGLVNGGTVMAYSIVGGLVTSTQIGSTTTTAPDGTYSIDVGNYSGPLLIKVTGGTYIDEATGILTNLDDQMKNNPLRAVVPNVTGSVSVAVTPLTEMAFQRLDPANITTQTITDANNVIATAFNLDSIITTLPIMPSGTPSNTQTNAETYQRALEYISQITKASPAGTMVADVIANDFNNTKISSNGSIDPATQTKLTAAQSQPLTILSAYRTSAFSNGTDKIRLYATGATYTTPVTFTVVSGQATFDNGTSTITVITLTDQQTMIDMAQTDIKSSTSGDVTIKATYTNGSTALTTVSFVNKIGDKVVKIYLTSDAIQNPIKLNNKAVIQLKFKIISNNSSGTVSLIDSISSINSFGVEQLEATNTIASIVSFVPVSLTSSVPLSTLTYGYNPSAPTFTVVPIGNVILSDGTTVTLTSADFVVVQ